MASQSEHPLAEAVVNKLKERDTKTTSLSHFESITGKGVHAIAKDTDYYIGNRSLLKEKNIQISEGVESNTQRLQSEAKTVVYFANDKFVLAMIAITDKIKETSKDAIASLQAKGIDVYMLTGDN
jgi:Cu2+-exporting ATPase